ncbi:MAG TPA: carboxypeptidase-like regulatory domain-containing protein [Pirellulales bacterium]|nr:carboxypeptidase-like regulatory domain-containing protein [Pirellulales bacterium]
MKMHAKRKRSRTIALAATLATAVSFAAAQECAALIMGGFGNEPVHDAGWPSGALEVANLKSRVGWWEGPPFGGGMYVFLYREKDTHAFNEALSRFAQIKCRKLELVIHDGPHESFWLRNHEQPARELQPEARVDWTFTVWRPESWHRLYNTRGTFFSDRKEFGQPVDPPRIDLYIGQGAIDFSEVKMPEGVIVRDERQSTAPVKLEGGSTLVGRVTDMHTGKPIAGARIEAVKSVAKPLGGYEVQRLAEGVANGDGEYELTGVDPGAHNLQVRAAGFASRAIEQQPADHPVYRLIDIELSPAASLSGNVFDASGNPLAGVIVSTTAALAIDGRGYASAVYRKAETDRDGHFELRDLPTGVVQLSYRKEHYYHTPLGDLLSVPGDPIEVAMVRTGTIRGTVTEAGKPVAAAAVSLNQEGKAPGTFGGVGTWGGGMNTDEQGRFEFAGAPPGKYQIQVADQTKIVDLRGGQNLEVKIEK